MKLKHPVIFIHGLIVTARFYRSFSRLNNIWHNYSDSFRLYERPSWSLQEQRVELLTRFLDRISCPFHLIGHSAGGIDSRAALSQKSRASKNCLSLITIGTPHRGTPIADKYLKDFEGTGFDEILLSKDGNKKFAEKFTEEMTPAALKHFNSSNNNVDGINYSYIPSFIEKRHHATFSAWSSHKYLQGLGHISNDGTVPLSSQAWGEALPVVNACHKSQTVDLWHYGPIFRKRPVVKDVMKVAYDHLFKIEQGLTD